MAEFYENIEVNGTLDSSGKITTSELKITTGAADTKVLTSDVDGNATWEDATGGIALTALSVGTEGAASGDGDVSYNDVTGVFTYTPPDLTGLATGTNTGDVTLLGTPDYLTLVGQDITLGQIDLTTDVTGLLPTANVADLTGVNTGDQVIPVSTVDFDPVGTDNSTDVTLTGTPDYIAITGQAITVSQIDLAADITGVLPTSNVQNLSGTNTGNEIVFAGTTAVAGTNDGIVLDDGTVATGLRFLADNGTWITPAGTDDQDSSEVNTVLPATNFTGNLSASDTTVQAALETLDALVIPAGGTDDQTGSEVPLTITAFNNNLSGTDTNVQLALDTLDNLAIPVTAVDFDPAGTDNSNNNAVNTLYSGLVTNATHTGDVTGDVALTLESIAITGQAEVTPIAGDFLLFSDTSDSGNLKKVNASLLLGGGGAGGIYDVANDNITVVNSTFIVKLADSIEFSSAAGSNPFILNAETGTDSTSRFTNNTNDFSVESGLGASHYGMTYRDLGVTKASHIADESAHTLKSVKTNGTSNLILDNSITNSRTATLRVYNHSTSSQLIWENSTFTGHTALNFIVNNGQAYFLQSTYDYGFGKAPTEFLDIAGNTRVDGDLKLVGYQTFLSTAATEADAMKIHQEDIGGVGRVTFEGTTGSLLTVIDDKDNELWTASDVSGNPIGYIDADWNVRFGNPFNRPLEMTYDSGTGANDIFVKLGIAGANPTAGDVLKAVDSTGKLEWGTAGAGDVVEQETAYPILFTDRKNYFTRATPDIVGTITSTLTTGVLGIIQKIYINAASLTVPVGWIQVGDGVFFPSVLNIVYVEWITSTQAEYWVVQDN